MTKKIFYSIFLVAIAVLLACFSIIMGVLYDYSNTIQKNHMKDELELVAQAVETSGVQYLERLETDSCRITLVSSDGDVLYDSKKRADTLENHAKISRIPIIDYAVLVKAHDIQQRLQRKHFIMQKSLQTEMLFVFP